MTETERDSSINGAVSQGGLAGWTVGPHLDGGYGWHAWGLRGSRFGIAATEAEARRRALDTYADLRLPCGGAS